MENQNVNTNQEQNVNQNTTDNKPEEKKSFFQRLKENPKARKAGKIGLRVLEGLGILAIGFFGGKAAERHAAEDCEKLTDGTVEAEGDVE